MLIETPYKVGDVVSVKLSSGEEVVARLESEDNNNVVLHKPMALVNAAQGIGLGPFMFTTASENLKINTGLVMCVAKTEDNMSKSYTSSTTGIVT